MVKSPVKDPEIVVNQHDRCGEGPLWDWRSEQLVWTDLPTGRMYAFVPSTAKVSIVSDQVMAAGIGLKTGGGYILAGSDGLFAVDSTGWKKQLLQKVDGKKLILNDMLVDPKGRIYVGSYYWGDDMLEPGALYLVDETLQAKIVADNILLSNGLGLSLDGRTLYLADTGAREIYTFDVDPDDGSLRNRKVLVRVPPDEGLPDGLTVDASGHIWNAHWYGSEVVRYDPEGIVERRIRFPSKQISSVAFGGPAFTDLYVTSAGESWPSRYMPPGYDPHSDVGGPLYRVSMDIAGRREFEARVWE